MKKPSLRSSASIALCVASAAVLPLPGFASERSAHAVPQQPAAEAAATVVSPVPANIVNRYHLDTRWYAKYVQGPKDSVSGKSIPVLGSAAVSDATLLKAARQLEGLVRAYPYYAVNELDRRNVRVVLIARGGHMSNIPEVRAAWGTQLDERYWAGMGATDALPLSVGTEANLMDNFGDENIFIHEFGHTVADMSLRYIDPNFTAQLQSAYNQAKSAGLWRNTYAISTVSEYWAEGVQSYFSLNREGPTGGDGVHNDINTRAELSRYDPKLFDLLDRVYRGAPLEAVR